MICAVVLAAGRSERMGTQKLLLSLGKRPVIACVVDELLRSPLYQILVVVGRDGEQIQSALAGSAVAFFSNPDPAGDMLSSVRCGLRALPDSCEAVLVVLGDQPGVTQGRITELVHAYHKSSCGIIVPTHAGRRGHPLLFAARYREEILTRHDGVGLHGLLAAHPEAVAELEVSTAAELEDMDTPEDYQRELRSLRSCDQT